jgi:hypothetical protein
MTGMVMPTDPRALIGESRYTRVGVRWTCTEVYRSPACIIATSIGGARAAIRLSEWLAMRRTSDAR